MNPLVGMVKSGIYRHYKGPLYNVEKLGHDANEEGRTVVIYTPLQAEPGHMSGPATAVREIKDFLQIVCADDECPHYGQSTFIAMESCETGGCECDTHSKKRFEFLGAEREEWMLK